jgi:hypothetical protein
MSIQFPSVLISYHCQPNPSSLVDSHHLSSIHIALDLLLLIDQLKFTMPGVTQDQPPKDYFEQLVASLSEKLGPSSGIDSADVDELELQKLMQDYVSNESEWKKYSFTSQHLPYTRNLVDKGNGKSNLVSFLVLASSAID